MLPEALRREMAGPGVQDLKGSLAGTAFQDELGVLPKRMGNATAAMIFAARIVLVGNTEEVSRGNFQQNRKEKVSSACGRTC